MLFILLSWLYIIGISTVFGVSMNQFFRLKNSHHVITICLGFFGIALLTGIWAIGFPVNGYFQLLLLSLSVFFCFVNHSHIKSYASSLKVVFSNLSLFLKCLFVVISILILAQCASAPFVIDNESYYIQTIKWLNEYGYVKGLVNLHLFLGQTSGWHVLQSAFNFNWFN